MPAPPARVPARSLRPTAFGSQLIAGQDLTILRVTGDLDLDFTGDLRDLLVAAVDSGPTDVAVDLSAVRFIGSRSLGTLAVAARRALDQGRRLHVVASRPAVTRAIELTGLAEFLRLTSSGEHIAGWQADRA
jgi:anti-sigma B factor antagonist